jgi:hypothetical protein
MKRYAASVYCSIAFVIAFFYACNDKPSNVKVSDKVTENSTSAQYGGYANQEAWGAHLVDEHGCKGCHTPKKRTPQGIVMDSALLLSGHPAQMPPPDIDRKMVETKKLTVSSEEANAWIGKWGISYADNLTPDASGIGHWKVEQFIYAIREGKYKGLAGSRPLLPPMPWRSYRHMNDDELKAMFAYLQSIKPINNLTPQAQPPIIQVEKGN